MRAGSDENELTGLGNGSFGFAYNGIQLYAGRDFHH